MRSKEGQAGGQVLEKEDETGESLRGEKILHWLREAAT